MSTGMTYDEVLDQLDFPALQGFTDYWRSHPPVHVMVAAYLGIEPQSKPSDKPREVDESTIAELMGAFERTPGT